jgi:hypothetical protein
MVATLAFLVVRTSAGHHAQEAMEDEVTKYFASNVAGAFIEEKLGALASDLVVRQTTDLQVQVETIRSVLEEDGYIIPGTLTK